MTDSDRDAKEGTTAPIPVYIDTPPEGTAAWQQIQQAKRAWTIMCDTIQRWDEYERRVRLRGPAG